ncbi:sensor histidine kinase [Pontixanthobacter gangjinensis]|uniref:histidine kinase n=1 Tax=Pontixanthobacter gangjinensis TaxID=1028742 RepID=A0A6I4SMV3_9SPHN|nr:ATP-binding protein [Pontixanthobacter gangjinensis]MXO57115.1 two-component sensor histidine kinase [Pontixanthobacter gangjinensis]
MDERVPIPWPSFALCAAGLTAMLVSGASFWLALGIGAVWAGSLLISVARPPEERVVEEADPFSSANMSELVEYAGTPILLVERGRISVANRAMRKLLGSHIVGQDARVALRHPKAIKLIDSPKNGFAQVRGLARRRDVWRVNKQNLSNGIAVIELLNQTAEIDVSRAHTDFVANASHELRTPLASIIGYVETIRDDEDLPPKTKAKFLDTILAEGKRLQSLVSDLMSLSRIEAEKHEQPQDHVAFNALVESSSHDVAGLNRTDRLVFELGKEMTVLGDTRQLEQLVRNLVDNALKYGDRDKSVTISVSKTEAGEAKLTVSDQGAGIDPEQIPHLTRRFYRTDPGRSRASGGTGLGLAIVKHIVERHRGRLDILSEQGQGTSIVVRIPTLDNTPS